MLMRWGLGRRHAALPIPWLLAALLALCVPRRAHAQGAGEPFWSLGERPQGPTTELLPSRWNTLSPGAGFSVARASYGELRISAYVLARYLHQFPRKQSFVDHRGVESRVDTRQDLQLTRMLLWLSGFVYVDRLRYECVLWSVDSATQLALLGNIAYTFADAFKLHVGVTGHPGTRSMAGAFPYFFGTDRQLADEFFRPGFTVGVWAGGELFDILGYQVMAGNSLGRIAIAPRTGTFDVATSASVWLMPTTGEFGPGGGFGDYQLHSRVATRVGASFTRSREDRESQLEQPSLDPVPIRLSDSLLLFEPDALAPGVSVTRADYDMLALDAGLKYRGLHVQSEYYLRWLRRLKADGALPVGHMFDHGFSLQAGYHVWPKRLELFVVDSHVFGRFGDGYEVGGGFNTFPLSTRNFRLNTIALYVHDSPVDRSSSYYVGGQRGAVISVATDLLF